MDHSVVFATLCRGAPTLNTWYLDDDDDDDLFAQHTDTQTTARATWATSSSSSSFIYYTRTEHKIQKLNSVNKSMEGY